jgi:pimeloyl-ACP methyl ester carboxylesterase
MTDKENILERSGGVHISYRLISKRENNKVIVLCHGLASNMTRWAEFAELTSLKEIWDIILPDLRGHGGSVYRGLISMEEWCSDIAAILDKEKYDRVVIGGHCLGANLAINFAESYPDKCNGIVLLEPLFSQSFTGVLKKIEKHKRMLDVLIVFTRLINMAGIYRRSFPSLDLRELDRAGRELIKAAGTPEVLRKRYGSPVHDLRYIPVAAYLQSVRESLRPLPEIEKLAIPKLFIFSSGRLFSESCDVNEVCGSAVNSESVIIDSYHWVPTEKPVELRGAIEKWCNKHFS